MTAFFRVMSRPGIISEIYTNLNPDKLTVLQADKSVRDNVSSQVLVHQVKAKYVNRSCFPKHWLWQQKQDNKSTSSSAQFIGTKFRTWDNQGSKVY
jgi:hypothetical protein